MTVFQFGKERDTITDALPDQYKDKTRQQVGRKGRHKQLVQGNVSGGTITTTADLPDSNRVNLSPIFKQNKILTTTIPLY